MSEVCLNYKNNNNNSLSECPLLSVLSGQLLGISVTFIRQKPGSGLAQQQPAHRHVAFKTEHHCICSGYTSSILTGFILQTLIT